MSSSVPIALYDMMQANGDRKMANVMLAGFGVGLSWAGCMVNLK